MKQYLALGAMLMVAACNKPADAAPAADTTAAAAPAVVADSADHAQHDSTAVDTSMVRDSAAQ